MTSRLSVLLFAAVVLLASQTFGSLRSWILTRHDGVGFQNLSQAAMDSMAWQYDVIDGYDGAQYRSNQEDPQITYLKSQNPDMLITLYVDNSFSGWRAGYFFHIYADSFGVNEEDCYLHFKRDANQNQSAVVDDKFGAANVYGDGAWFYGPAGQGVFAYDASANSWNEFTDPAYYGTSQQFCADVGDCLYLGQIGRFKEANFSLSSAASGGWNGVWEYYNGSAWTALSGVSDGTSAMTQSGQVTWSVPTAQQWVNHFPSDEVFINKWVRLRCTSAGSAPSLSTVKGEDYIEGTTIPGWDPANDTNGDGVWDTNVNSGATATFRWHSRMKGAWGSFKHRSNYYDKNSEAFLRLFKIYIYNYIKETGADGYMGDDWPWADHWGPDIPSAYDNVWGFEAYSDQEEADSAWRHWSVARQAQALRDTLVASNIPDTLVGGNVSEVGSIPYFPNPGGGSSPMHYHMVEFYNKLANGGPWYSDVETEFLRNPVVGAAKGQSQWLAHYYSTYRWGNEKVRWDNFCLASHYLIAGPNIYFGIVRTTTDARTLGWIKATDFNVGQPLIPNNYADTMAHSWYVWDDTDHIYARDFSNALVMARFRASATVDSSTAKTYYLGAMYRRLNSDSTFFAPSDSVTLLAGDGAILVPLNQNDDSTPPGDIIDLGAVPGNNHGEVNLTWTAPGDDGSTGQAHHYEIRYSTAPITAINWTIAALHSGSLTPLGPGSLQSTTVTGLEAGEFYYFAIKTFDEMGNASAISNLGSSYAAGIKVPLMTSTDVDSVLMQATLVCSTVESYHAGISYEFGVMTDTLATRSEPLPPDGVTGSEASVVISDLQADSTYFWQCRAVASGVDSSDWSGFIRFNLSNVAPSPPVCSSPVDLDTVLTLTPLLVVVNGIDGDSDPLTYEFELYDATTTNLLASVADVAEGNAVTSWQVPVTLTSGTDYTWRSRCSDPTETSTWMAIAHFTAWSISTGLVTAVESIKGYPNPVSFSEAGSIIFSLPDDPVDLAVVTVSGTTVIFRTNLSGDWSWNGRNESGSQISPGVYLWYVTGSGHNTHGKIVVLP